MQKKLEVKTKNQILEYYLSNLRNVTSEYGIFANEVVPQNHVLHHRKFKQMT